ncbi:ABC transporter permease [Litorihabitans aurantiacus]|uniref:ABC transporter permease n=1 Tax=Litorihabitans aurantiacus TaxID=1930061 RepID=A0AA37XH05_9MICO|nr:ABC transporter permease [Litorihabitans aurantiacus]GMA33152.1 ABC transporter permease [Litorihabitans aurantiacus]
MTAIRGSETGAVGAAEPTATAPSGERPAPAVRRTVPARRSAGSRRFTLSLAQLATVAVLLAAWEVAARSGVINPFLFSSPGAVVESLVRRAADGALANDVRVTMTEIVLGYLLGAVGGSLLGLGLWYSRLVADYSAPFIAAIGAIPVLAIAPMTIIWFGTGLLSKVMIVAFSCVVVSLTNAYRGAQRADVDQVNLMRSFGASQGQIFRKVVVPGALPWVIQGLKLNVGFAVVGAVIGEYISSNAGVGHMILLGSSSFAVNIVLAGLVMVMAIVLLLSFLVNLLERSLLSWERTGQ